MDEPLNWLSEPASLDLLTQSNLIDSRYRKPDAVTAALLANGNALVARIAAGAIWREDTSLTVSSKAGARAARHALVWDRIARVAEGLPPD